jgi:outer membrane protein assembly factor BamE (lipoprotein component of BamABCDE complex)
MKKLLCLTLTLPMLILQGCQTAASHRADIRDDSGDKVTVGRVQREVRVGMSGGGVIEVLGSPNIVTTDEERREVWVYDKFATETIYSTSSGGVSALVLGWGGNVAGAASPSVSGSTGAASKTQRTLTIIIKFDKDKKVRDFAYHASSF